MTAPIRVPLVVDPNSAFLSELRGEALLQGSEPPFTATNLEDALQILRMNRSLVSVIVVSTEFGNHMVQNIVHAAVRFIPGLPVILVSDHQATDFTADELRKMFVQTVLQRPLSFSSLYDQISSAAPPPAAQNFLIQDPSGQATLPPKRNQKLDQDFAPIQTQSISPVSSMPEDVYVRIRKDRYVKVLKQGYAIGAERLERYVRRGIKSFYTAKKRAG